MIETLSTILIALAALYFVALGGLSLLAPKRAKLFLLAFAGTASKHFLELTLRLLVGAAMIVHAPRMHWPGAFALFGWILAVSTVCLLVIPWRWHRRFAERMVPKALDYIALIGLSSLALGALILLALVRPSGI